jgi:hypothetical protein
MSTTSQNPPHESQDTTISEPPPPPLLPRTLHGSCHCRHVTYTAEIALPFRPTFPVASRCNCTICLKTGFTNIQPHNGREGFKLLTPKGLDEKLGEGRLGDLGKLDGIGDYCNLDKLNRHDEEGVTKNRNGSQNENEKGDRKEKRKEKEKNSEIHRYFCQKCSVMICAEGRYFMPSSPGKTERSRKRPEDNLEERNADSRLGVEATSVNEPDSTDTDSNDKAERGNSGDADREEQLEEEDDGEEGEIVDFFSINLGTLDQPQEGLDLSLFKMEYYDGRNNNWMGGRREAPWSGGLV